MKNIERYIQIYDDVISGQLCDLIIEKFTKDENKEPSEVEYKSTELIIKTDNEDWKDIDDMLFQILNTNLKLYFENSKYSFTPQTRLDDSGYKIQHYEKNQGKYQSHFDVNGIETWNRFLGVIFYLNDVEEGGETNFPDIEYSVKPKRGRMLFFPCQYPLRHEGLIPISNDKYIINTFILVN
jgi:hypothetical protein